MNETVYLVKFDRGYYAAKQPNYHWSFTDDPVLAQPYKTLKKARERGKWGEGLKQGLKDHTYVIQSYVIERYTVKTVFEFEGVE